MISNRIRWELALLALLTVLCVGLIFFFPASQGTYSAVHGPVTALQSARSAARVRLAIVVAAFSLTGNFQVPSLAWLKSSKIVRIEPQTDTCNDCGTILRC